MASGKRLQKKQWLALGLLVLASAVIGIVLANGFAPQDFRVVEGQDDVASKNKVGPVESQVRPVNGKSRPIEMASRGYIKSDSCRECHAEHYDTWHASHHRTMTQVPSQDSVIADFDDKVLTRSGQQFRFFHQGDDYFMELKNLQASNEGKSQASEVFKIVLMTGAHHQQAFWCETDKERTLKKIPFIWINKEQRWVPYGSIFMLPSSGLSMHEGTWNHNCIKCHVVGGQPRLDPAAGFDTHVAEFGISCEACHGPGEAHAAQHAELASASGRPIGNPEMINPANLSHQKSSQTCGQCHSVFDFYDQKSEGDYMLREGFAFRPGDELTDSRHVFRFGKDEDLLIVKQKLKRNPKFWEQQFWSDGMVRVSGREYNGLLETPCYQRGTMSCMSCHDMHPGENDSRPREQWADDQMKVSMRGNDACLQCHAEYKSEEKLALHTHHAPESSGSNCYNCHMPHTSLGLMKAMRSHTIDSPDVATTVATGRPNACNLCHLDKSLGWTAEHLEEWYERPLPKLTSEESEVASSVRWILKGDAGQRAIVGWHMGWSPAQQASETNWMAPYLAELLTDSYDVVRFIGYHSLKELPQFSEFDYDFVGSEQTQQQGRDRVLRLWNESSNRPKPSRELFISGQRALIEKEFDAMRKLRVDPPMILIE